MDPGGIDAYLEDCRQLTLRALRDIVPRAERYRPVLYDLMLDYPMRRAKALRPALCIAACRALGGPLEAVLRSAAVLELYHNAFLIHDDVEDGSESRRERPTLHNLYGVPIAVNVGDAMLALALEPLLDNMRVIGMGKALRILQIIARMARESAEGQATELDWIRHRCWQLMDADYVRMVYKKTSWYTFISPLLIGAITAGAPAAQLTVLRKLGALLGIAFQIQDDVLNLAGEGDFYGKEIAGDLWEGKHTLIVMHMMRSARPAEQQRAQRILSKPRPSAATARVSRTATSPQLLRALERRGDLSAAGRQAIEQAHAREAARKAAHCKTEVDIRFLMALIERYGSIDYARGIAQRFARKAETTLDSAAWLPPSVHTGFLRALIDFVVERNR